MVTTRAKSLAIVQWHASCNNWAVLIRKEMCNTIGAQYISVRHFFTREDAQHFADSLSTELAK